jgi:hypothetical protein
MPEANSIVEEVLGKNKGKEPVTGEESHLYKISGIRERCRLLPISLELVAYVLIIRGLYRSIRY